MKHFIISIMIMFNLTLFSQTNSVVIPYEVGIKILLDLNRKDELELLYKNQLLEITKLGGLIQKKDTLISNQVEIINTYEKTILINDNYTKTLERENHKLNETNTKLINTRKVTNIIGGSIIAVLVTLLIIK